MAARRENFSSGMTREDKFIYDILIYEFDVNNDELNFNQPSGFPRINAHAPWKTELFHQMCGGLFICGVSVNALLKLYRLAGRRFWTQLILMRNYSKLTVITRKGFYGASKFGGQMFCYTIEKDIVALLNRNNVAMRTAVSYLEDIQLKDRQFWLLKAIIAITRELIFSIATSWLCQIIITFFDGPKKSSDIHKQIASLRMLLDSTTFQAQIETKITVLKKALSRTHATAIPESSQLKYLINSYNAHFVIAYLLDELNIYANKPKLNILAASYTPLHNVSHNPVLLQTSYKQYYSDIINFCDPYKANLLFILMFELDIIYFNAKLREFDFNADYCQPTFLTYLPLKQYKCSD